MNVESVGVKTIQKSQRCYPTRPCKRMICGSCRYIRRLSFVGNGVKYIATNKLNTFVTVNFTRMRERHGYEWDDLFHFNRLIWNKFKRQGVKFVKCLAMATNEHDSFLHPHIHLILTEREAARYIDIANEYCINLECKTSDKLHVYDAENLLGYFYDQNFIETQLIKSKPARVKLLTASKGLKCGFPELNTSLK